jgi:hypothetical protein
VLHAERLGRLATTVAEQPFRQPNEQALPADAAH